MADVDLQPDVFTLKGSIKDYHWGSRRAIAELLGSPSPTAAPQAELWLGAHTGGPTEAAVDSGTITVEELARIHPNEIMGPEVTHRFGGKFPFLLKILAAEKPLSIQAHPNLEQAARGFQRENTAGISLDAPNRSYKDDNHKPEILCALTSFTGLKGFRNYSKITAYFKDSPCPSFGPELREFLSRPNRDSLKDLYRNLLNLDQNRKPHIVDELVAAAKEGHFGKWESEWILRLHEHYPDDPGIMSVLLLNLVALEPGEAIATGAGQLHAYLHGVGVELMASSDNVLRGGLTSKHTDVEELLQVVSFEPTEPEILRPEPNAKRERLYRTDTKEFLLTSLELDGSYVGDREHGLEIWIVINGSLSVAGGAETKFMQRGTAFMMPAILGRYEFQGKAELFRATAGL